MTNTPDIPPKAKRSRGRPKRADAPEVDYPDLDKLLVFGEVIPLGPDGSGGTNVVYPSYRDLAKRFGLSLTTIAEYARSHNCLRRREVAQLRTQARVEEKLVERRAEDIAVSKEEQLVIIDSYIAGFKKALVEGRVRYDSPADFNIMARLKEFLLGDSDPRHDTHGPTLEQLQTRHDALRREMKESTPAECGELAPMSNAPAKGELSGEPRPASEEPAEPGDE
jgi:hypothetical protein